MLPNSCSAKSLTAARCFAGHRQRFDRWDSFAPCGWVGGVTFVELAGGETVFARSGHGRSFSGHVSLSGAKDLDDILIDSSLRSE